MGLLSDRQSAPHTDRDAMHFVCRSGGWSAPHLRLHARQALSLTSSSRNGRSTRPQKHPGQRATGATGARPPRRSGRTWCGLRIHVTVSSKLRTCIELSHSITWSAAGATTAGWSGRAARRTRLRLFCLLPGRRVRIHELARPQLLRVDHHLLPGLLELLGVALSRMLPLDVGSQPMDCAKPLPRQWSALRPTCHGARAIRAFHCRSTLRSIEVRGPMNFLSPGGLGDRGDSLRTER